MKTQDCGPLEDCSLVPVLTKSEKKMDRFRSRLFENRAEKPDQTGPEGTSRNKQHAQFYSQLSLTQAL